MVSASVVFNSVCDKDRQDEYGLDDAIIDPRQAIDIDSCFQYRYVTQIIASSDGLVVIEKIFSHLNLKIILKR
jgi:hypothetical protein